MYPLMALSMSLFAASCSQDSMLNDTSGNEKTTVSVQLPVKKGSRAVPNIPDGYQLRCKMQVVDAEGNTITGDEYTQTNTVPGSGTLTFTFTTPENEYKTLFWADYVPASADVNNDYLYNTSDLSKGVTYTADKLTDGSLFNTESADGFYGVGDDGATSIELKRPFTRLKVRANKAYEADYAAYDQVSVKMTVPSGINLLTGASTGTTSEVAYNGSTDKAENFWFSNYVFTGNDIANLGTDFSFTLKSSDGSSRDKTISITGTDVPLAANKIHILNVKPGAAGKSEITVTFPGDMNDPDVLSVGQYIYKDGTHGSDYTKDAVAIVFKVTDGTAEGDSPANYTAEANGTDMTGKTIAGYAVSINYVNRLVIGGEEDFPGWAGNTPDYVPGSTTPYAALANSNGILKTMEGKTSPLIDAYNQFIADNAISGGISSKWYIPSWGQLTDYFTAWLGYGDTAKDEKVANAFAQAGVTVITRYNESYFMSANMTAENTILCITTQTEDKTADTPFFFKKNDGKEAKLQTIKAGSALAVRPVITLFK